MRPVPGITTMRCLRSFWLEGRTVEPGEVVEIIGSLALVLARSGRAEPINPADRPNTEKDHAHDFRHPA